MPTPFVAQWIWDKQDVSFKWISGPVSALYPERHSVPECQPCLLYIQAGQLTFNRLISHWSLSHSLLLPRQLARGNYHYNYVKLLYYVSHGASVGLLWGSSHYVLITIRHRGGRGEPVWSLSWESPKGSPTPSLTIRPGCVVICSGVSS